MTNVKTQSRTPTGPTTTDTAQTRLFEFSAPKIVGGALAAATAAFLGSRIGVAGTVFGAAIVSVITAVSTTLFTGSIHATRKRVSRLRGRDAEPEAASAALPGAEPVPDGRRLPAETLPVGIFLEDDRRVAPPRERVATPVRQASGKRWAIGGAVAGILVTAVASFAVAMGLVTGAEVTTGRSLDGKGRTTIGQVAQQGPSVAPSATPTVSVTPTASATPTASPTATPSATPTSTSSATPTATPTPTVQPTAAPTGTTTPAPQG